MVQKSEKFVVIGGDAAGMSAASRAKRYNPSLEVEVFEQGEFVSYGACGIPYYISGEVKNLEDLVVVTPEEFREKRGIEVNLWHKVEKIVPEQKTIVVHKLKEDKIIEISYDKLLISTGARPFVPEGIDTSIEGVFTVRGLNSARKIKEFIVNKQPESAVIIGAGYIGLEFAEAFKKNNMKVTVVEFLPRVIPVMEEEVSSVVLEELEKNSVEVITGVSVEEIRQREGKLLCRLSNGNMIETDMVLVSVGVRPNSELAREAGIELGVRGAIKVNRYQETSIPDIYAAGDCSEVYHLLLKKNTYIPLALTANRQGRVVGDNVVGKKVVFPGVLGTAVTKIFDMTVARTGLGFKEAQEAGVEVEKVMVKGGSRAHYYPGGSPVMTVLIVDKKTGKPVGVQMAGRDGVSHRIDIWVAGITGGFTLTDFYNLDLAYAPPFSPVWDPVLVASQVASKKIK